ncbi:MAG: SMP-30/gluconolactonase/LRE family protein [Pseudomonadota bacterium]
MTGVVNIEDVGKYGTGLSRPECVLCKADGTVFCSDARGGIYRINADETQDYLGPDEEGRFRSNGFALLRDGTLVFVNIGSEGGIWAITPDGLTQPFLLDKKGDALGEVNFILVGPDETIWFSVMATTPHGTRLSATREDGYLARINAGVVEIMATGLNCANEFKIDQGRGRLYLNETFKKRTLCFDVTGDGTLNNRRVFAEFGPGEFPDGLSIDVEGHLWITCVVSNRILRVSPQGEIVTVLDGGDATRITNAEFALANETLSRDVIYSETAAPIQNPTSIAFGGSDLRTAYVGSLNHSELKTFISPVAGVKPVHWEW